MLDASLSEVRRVPSAWRHPRNWLNLYKPLRDHFVRDLRDWDEQAEWWARGMRRHYTKHEFAPQFSWVPVEPEHAGKTFVDYSGMLRPRAQQYMPDFPREERTCYQLYETVSDGTPLSPVCRTPEELAQWLETFAFVRRERATYEQWLALVKAGSTKAFKRIYGIEFANITSHKEHLST